MPWPWPLVRPGATPAWADPAGPTNDAARITAIEPAAEGSTIDVVGGDAFLRLQVEPGTRSWSLGYEGEPYLRSAPTAPSRRTAGRPPRCLNTSRYGPRRGLSDSRPRRPTRVGPGGRRWRAFVWHDHRIHWMSPDHPPQLGGVLHGQVPGLDRPWSWTARPLWCAATSCARRPRPSPGWGWPWRSPWGPWRSGWRLADGPGRGARRWLAAGLATATSLMAELGVPARPGGDGPWWPFRPGPGVRRRGPGAPPVALRRTLVVASAVVLPLWIGLKWDVLTNALLPTATASGLQRLAVAAALGAVSGRWSSPGGGNVGAGRLAPGPEPVY